MPLYDGDDDDPFGEPHCFTTTTTTTLLSCLIKANSRAPLLLLLSLPPPPSPSPSDLVPLLFQSVFFRNYHGGSDQAEHILSLARSPPPRSLSHTHSVSGGGGCCCFALAPLYYSQFALSRSSLRISDGTVKEEDSGIESSECDRSEMEADVSVHSFVYSIVSLIGTSQPSG